jgi:hypothetical protein
MISHDNSRCLRRAAITVNKPEYRLATKPPVPKTGCAPHGEKVMYAMGRMRRGQCRHRGGHRQRSLSRYRQTHSPIAATFRESVDRIGPRRTARQTRAACRDIRCGESSDAAHQQQDQQNDDDDAQAAAAIIAGTVERSAAEAAEAAKQNNDQYDEKDRSNRHGVSSSNVALEMPARPAFG